MAHICVKNICVKDIDVMDLDDWMGDGCWDGALHCMGGLHVPGGGARVKWPGGGLWGGGQGGGV